MMRGVVWFCCLLLLAGCGFHLRTTPPLPDTLQHLQVKSATPQDPWVQQFIDRLHDNGVQPNVYSGIRLEIIDATLTQSGANLNSNMQLRQYNLTQRVRWRLWQKTQTLTDIITVSATQPLERNPQIAHASEYQQQRIEAQLREETIMQVLRQLNSRRIRESLARATHAA